MKAGEKEAPLVTDSTLPFLYRLKKDRNNLIGLIPGHVWPQLLMREFRIH